MTTPWPAGDLRDELVAALAEHRVRMTPTGDGGVRLSVTPHEEVVDALLPAVVRALTEARADELEQAADAITSAASNELAPGITDQLIAAGQWVAAQLVTDRATALRASIRQTNERNDR